MTQETLTSKLKAQIDRMSREEMARAWRFAGAGDPRFQGEAGSYFQKRFEKLGGWSPTLSNGVSL